MTQRGPALVRLPLFALVFGAFALCLVQPAQAGTEAAPEIQDPAGDQAAAGQDVSEAGFDAADIVTVWIDQETATGFVANIRVSGDIVGGVAGSQPTTYYRYTLTMVQGGTTYTAGADVHFEAVATPEGVASAAVVDGDLLQLTILKSAIGNPAAGALLSGLFVESSVHLPSPAPDETLVSDRAPNADAGTDYKFGGAGGNATTPGDSDGDMLNDTCELRYFPDLNGTNNASADPDNDGLTNGQECAGGTDPTKADTDGDGTNDKQDPSPTDPAVGGSGSSSASTSRSGTGSGTATTSDGAGGEGEVRNIGDAVDRLQSDMAYFGTSAASFLVVLVLCILALAVRWSL